MSLTLLSVTGSGRWFLVGMDIGSVPTETSSPVRTGPLYPRIRSRSSRAQCCTEEEASVIVFTFGMWCCSGIRGRRRRHFLLASVLLAAWAKTSEAGHLSGWGLDVTMLAIFWDRVNEVLWLPLRSRRSHSRSWLQRPLTLTMYYIWASFVGKFTFADGECDGLLVLTCTVAVRTEVTRSDIAQPGMSDGRQKSTPCGRHCISDLAWVEDVRS